MPDSNFTDHSCRLRRRSSTFHSIPSKDLQNISDIERDPRRRFRSQSAFDEPVEQLSTVAALRFRLSELDSSPKQALEIIAQEALAATNAQGTAIAIAAGQEVLCCARAGDLGPPLGTPIDAESGLSGECLRSGEVVYCDDTESDPRVNVSACRQLGIRSVLAVPLRHNEQVIGIFAAFSAQLAAFGYSEARLVQFLADLASEPRILGTSPSNLSDLELQVPAATSSFFGILPPEKSTTKAESLPDAASTNELDSEFCSEVFSPKRWSLARSRRVSKCLETIRQDPALRLLGRAKAYLTIETLHDGIDRSEPIALFEELMFQRVAEIGAPLSSATS